MASSVMNGAIGKSPLIDKMNQLTAENVKSKTTAQMEQQECNGKTVKYPSVPVSFSGCKKEVRKQLARRREERPDGNADF